MKCSEIFRFRFRYKHFIQKNKCLREKPACDLLAIKVGKNTNFGFWTQFNETKLEGKE